MRFVTAISQEFQTRLKHDATLVQQKLHQVAVTKIVCVNGPLGSQVCIVLHLIFYERQTHSPEYLVFQIL